MARSSDEHRRPPEDDPWWADAWEVDFAATDGPAAEAGVGGFVRLALLPHQGVAWWWTALLTPRLVAVRDHEVPLPRTGLEVRADGLWGELVCETPLEHWSIGLEAFGIAYDDPADAWGDEWGQFSWSPESWRPQAEVAAGDNMVHFARSIADRLGDPS